MENITIPDKSTGDNHFASEVNQQTDWSNEPTQKLTAFTDTDIIIDGTKRYSTTKVITGSTHTITANATLSNHKENNYILVRYQFDVDCDLTLTNFDATGSTLGTINPIPAGTYNLWFYSTSFGVALVIQNNTGTTPGTLDTPTLVLTASSGQLSYIITGIDSNATAGVLEYSTDNVNWTTWGSYSFGTETGNITGLTNGVLYYGRYRNSASGYNPSPYAADSETPAAGVTQLIAPTMNAPTVNGTNKITVTCNDPNTSPQETNMFFRRATNSGMTTGLTTSQQAAGTTSHEWEGLDDNTTYYFDVIAQGDGATTTNSNPSNVVNETTDTYSFANTHELVIDAVSGEGVTVVNNDCYPSNGAGADADVSFEFWYETPSTIGENKTFFVGRDNNDDTVLFTVGRGSDDSIICQFLTDGSNTLVKKSSVSAISASTLYHIVIFKVASVIKIYLDGAEQSYQSDTSVGTYTGLPALVGDLELDIGNSQGGSSGTGNQQIFRLFDIELEEVGQIDFLYNSGTPRGIAVGDAPVLNAACQQENLFNNTPNADNIGNNGTNQGGVTYQAT